jgi:hypothetical protein
LAEQAEAQNLSYEAIADAAGPTGHAVRAWVQRGKDPTVGNLEAALNVVGFGLRAVRRRAGRVAGRGRADAADAGGRRATFSDP